MGWRFHKSIKILPGIRVNIGKAPVKNQDTNTVKAAAVAATSTQLSSNQNVEAQPSELPP